MDKKLYDTILEDNNVDEIITEEGAVNLPKIAYANAGSDKFPYSDADCSVVALSLLTKQPYQYVLAEIDRIIEEWEEDDKEYKEVKKQGDVLLEGLIDPVLKRYLSYWGWKLIYPKSYVPINTPRQLPDDCLIRLKSHVVTRVKGVILDTYDSRFDNSAIISINKKRILVYSKPAEIFGVAVPE